MKRQRGVTLTGMVIVSVIVVLLLILSFKVVPVYTEYFAIERHFKAMATDPKLRGASRGHIAGAWAARASVDNLAALDPDSIEVTKEADGIVLTAMYTVKVPLFRNVSLTFDFAPSSK